MQTRIAEYNGFEVAVVQSDEIISQYTSKALKDFIYECNHGKDVFFAASIEDAAGKLTKE